jgi:hypothetical protein
MVLVAEYTVTRVGSVTVDGVMGLVGDALLFVLTSPLSIIDSSSSTVAVP